MVSRAPPPPSPIPFPHPWGRGAEAPPRPAWERGSGGEGDSYRVTPVINESGVICAG
jgi:hypothetical protein